MVVGRKSIVLASLTALSFGVVIAAVAAAQGYAWLLRSDAQHFYRVALDPFGTGAIFDGASPGAGTAYRYGRILYPLIAWVLALGRPDWVQYTLPIAYLGGVWLLAAMACEFCACAKKPAERGLLVFALPAILITLPLLVPEMLIAGLALLMYRFVLGGRTRAAWATAALMLLARETMVLGLAPLILRSFVLRRWLDALAWAASAIPLFLWWTWVRHRTGYWPFLDPTVAFSRPLDLPFRGFLVALWDPSSHPLLIVAAATGWMTIALALWAHLSSPWFPLTAGALASSLLVVFFGPGQAGLPGEAFRVMAPAQVLVGLAYLCRRPGSRGG